MRTAHVTGYERNSINSVRCIWKTVRIHTTRSAHAPVSDTIIGMIEYPIPRKTPTCVSIMPQRKYGTHTMSIRSKPYWITSGSDVYIESKGVPSKYAPQPSTTPVTVTQKMQMRRIFATRSYFFAPMFCPVKDSAVC